jgi:hypothetical protein
LYEDRTGVSASCERAEQVYSQKGLMQMTVARG